jgi:hypothetical protein
MLRTFEVYVTCEFELNTIDIVVEAENAEDAVNRAKQIARGKLFDRMGGFPTERAFVGVAYTFDVDFNKHGRAIPITF